jgi:hypothetical protein
MDPRATASLHPLFAERREADRPNLLSVEPSMRKSVLALAILVLAAALVGAGEVAGATKKPQRDGCSTQVFQNGLDVVFGRARTQAAADRITQRAQHVGFTAVRTVRDSCTQWMAVLRGLDSWDTAVGVQAEARTVRLSPTVECVRADEVGQLQAIFATRRTLDDLADVIQRAKSFGYVGLKTKRGPCGGYQAYVAGFKSKAEAEDFARTAKERTGLAVRVIKA